MDVNMSIGLIQEYLDRYGCIIEATLGKEKATEKFLNRLAFELSKDGIELDSKGKNFIYKQLMEYFQEPGECYLRFEVEWCVAEKTEPLLFFLEDEIERLKALIREDEAHPHEARLLTKEETIAAINMFIMYFDGIHKYESKINTGYSEKSTKEYKEKYKRVADAGKQELKELLNYVRTAP